MLSPLVPDLDRLREELLATTPEDKAYYRGKSAAKQAIDILTRAGVLLPPIYGERGTDGVVEGLAAIAEQVGINPKVVYNPGSGLDVAIA